LSLSINLSLFSQWQQTNGVFGGRTYCFKETFGGIYVGTYNGVYYSNDTARNWIRKSNGISSGKAIFSMVNNGGNLLAGTNDGIYSSTNAGGTWNDVSMGLTNTFIRSILIDSAFVFAASQDGVFKSADGGNSWTSSSLGFSSMDITDLAKQGSTIFAGTFDGGLYKTSDSGATWSNVDSSFTGTMVSSIAVIAGDIFVSTLDSGVYRSSNGGQTWLQQNNGLPSNYITGLAIVGGNIIAIHSNSNVYISGNGGQNWSLLGVIGSGAQIYAIEEMFGLLWAGTDAGVYISSDGGLNWNEQNKGLSSPQLTCLASSGNNLYAGTKYAGLMLSQDNGNTWINPTQGTIQNIVDLKVTGSEIYVISPNSVDYTSTTIGSSWASIGTTNITGNLKSIEKQGSYTVIGTSTGSFFSPNNSGIWTSNGGGFPVGSGVTDLTIRGSSILATLNTGGHYYETSGSFLGYAQFGNPILPAANCISGASTSVIVGTDYGIYSSINNGVNWTTNSLQGAKVNTSLISGAFSFIGTDQGFFYSTNNGSTWVSANDGLMNHLNINSLSVIDSIIFVGTEYGGIFSRSMNNLISYQTPVWPGDSNSDHIVNSQDILPIGIYYSSVGSQRDSVSNLWQANSCLNWGVSQSNFSDIKHADCNGDGIIDMNDTLAINVNYNNFHTLISEESHLERTSTGPELYFLTQNSVYAPGDWIDIEIWLGSNSQPITNLYGLSFQINYTSSLVETLTESISIPSTWFGVPQVNTINFSKVESSSALLDIGMSRINHTNVQGFGKIAVVRFQAKTTISSSSTLFLDISGYSANDSVGNSISLGIKRDSLLIIPTVTSVAEKKNNESISIYPNPFTTQTRIELNQEYVNASVKIFDVLWKEQRSITFTGKAIVIDREFLKQGIYFIQIITEGKPISSQKLIIN
ncbi:MAG: T9SS type A sorting domain-containing protein, partial [Bacteroidia bacterium]|nr:T9SS type A sorting domain-containing protein [Bacteroidia bacterium]